MRFSFQTVRSVLKMFRKECNWDLRPAHDTSDPGGILRSGRPSVNRMISAGQPRTSR
jgi:hypothetical protein